jgi:hypothetical protein
MKGSSIGLRAVIVVMMLGARGVGLDAQPSGATEYEVKAAYLYNFGRFIQWPEDIPADQPFEICVVGRDPFGPMLDATLKGASISGRPTAVRRLSKAGEAGGCRIAFVSVSEAGRLKETLTALEGSGVLTVSDIPEFAQRGGAIQFVLAGNKVRFEINLMTAQNAGLVLSSDLLKVAIAIRKTVKAGG